MRSHNAQADGFACRFSVLAACGQARIGIRMVSVASDVAGDSVRRGDGLKSVGARVRVRPHPKNQDQGDGRQVSWECAIVRLSPGDNNCCRDVRGLTAAALLCWHIHCSFKRFLLDINFDSRPKKLFYQHDHLLSQRILWSTIDRSFVARFAELRAIGGCRNAHSGTVRRLLSGKK